MINWLPAPDKQSDNPDTRLAEIRALKDQDELKRLALDAVDPLARAVAAARVTDAATAAPLVQDDPDPRVRMAAVLCLTDIERLKQFAGQHPDREVQELARIRLLRDPEILARTARNDPRTGVREAALVALRLEDQAEPGPRSFRRAAEESVNRMIDGNQE